MLSRFLRLALIFELFGYLVIGVGLVRLSGWMPGAAVLAILLLALGWRALAIAATYLYAHAYQSPLAAGFRLPVARRCLEAGHELCAFAAIPFVEAFEHLLMRADAPRKPANTVAGQTPLLLIHGYVCNRGFWWWLKPRLEARGRRVATLSLEPVYADIDSYAEQIAQRVAWLRRETGAERVMLVGHSMGGLAALAYLRRYGEDYVAKLITLGTPHRGSVLARIGFGRNARQMEPGSTWLAELAQSLSDAPLGIPCIAYYSPHDNLVMPQVAAMLHGADNRVLPGLGHQAMGMSTMVLKELLEASAGE